MLARDAAYDGLFYVCVRTTRIFCRPSCAARKPRPDNVAFHACVRDCLLAGFRPCKRCRPLAANGADPPWIDALLERVEQDPSRRLTDADLREMRLDPHRVRRYFLRHFDMTFHAWRRARKMGLALEALRGGADPLRVALDHGYESSSGFRSAFEQTFGVTPGRAERVTRVTTTTIETPIGPLVAGATDAGICLLEFADRRALRRQIATLKRRVHGRAVVPGAHPLLDQLRGELGEYFDGRRSDFTLPLVAPGTPFQEQVWKALGRIPCGETRSYEQLARAIGRPGAQRAVGRANGDNRVALLIPCHRVVRSDGALCGYGGGLWRKKRLLELEAQLAGRLRE